MASHHMNMILTMGMVEFKWTSFDDFKYYVLRGLLTLSDNNTTIKIFLFLTLFNHSVVILYVNGQYS